MADKELIEITKKIYKRLGWIIFVILLVGAAIASNISDLGYLS